MACVLATVSFGVDATADLTFVATNGAVGVKAMTPTSSAVIFGTSAEFGIVAGVPGGAGAVDDLQTSDRLETHLPGVGGAYRSFGARHEAALLTAASFYGTARNGIDGIDAAGAFLANVGTDDDFLAAEWDAAREVLKITVNNVAVRSVYVDHNFLRLANSAPGLPPGLSPLPPNGGIDSNWYSTEPETLNLRMTVTQRRSRC